MAPVLSIELRARIAARYEVWQSVVQVRRWWRAQYGRHTNLDPQTIKNCHKKFLSIGSVLDAKRTGRPSTSGACYACWQIRPHGTQLHLSRECSDRALANLLTTWRREHHLTILRMPITVFMEQLLNVMRFLWTVMQIIMKDTKKNSGLIHSRLRHVLLTSMDFCQT